MDQSSSGDRKFVSMGNGGNFKKFARIRILIRAYTRFHADNEAKRCETMKKQRRRREKKKKDRTYVTCFNKSFRKFDIRASNFSLLLPSLFHRFRFIGAHSSILARIFRFVRSFPPFRAVFIYFLFFSPSLSPFSSNRFPCFGLPFTLNFYLLKRYVGWNISIVP